MKRTTRITGIVIGAGAGLAALAWMLKDRIMRPASKPAQPPPPAFRVSPPAVQSHPDADDLTAIRGIGPVFKARLTTAGVHRFEEVADLEPERLADLAGVPESRAREWIEQARSLI